MPGYVSLTLQFCTTCIDHAYIIIVHGVMSSNCTDGDVRLVGGSSDYEGLVEVCVNNVWGTICYGTSRYSYNYWHQSDGAVVCRQLGHQVLGRKNNIIIGRILKNSSDQRLNRNL